MENLYVVRLGVKLPEIDWMKEIAGKIFVRVIMSIRFLHAERVSTRFYSLYFALKTYLFQEANMSDVWNRVKTVKFVFYTKKIYVQPAHFGL